MLNRKSEYLKMAEVEARHWWYRNLHKLVLDALVKYNVGKNNKILDAGCGTGGGINFLHKEGYSIVRGIDLSPYAVDASQRLGLDVIRGDLRDIDSIYSNEKFRAIISNDVLYFLDKSEIKTFLTGCLSVLEDGGVLILNLPVLQIFSGSHDVSVGIKRRFSPKDVREIFSIDGFMVAHKLYWPFLLSPLILLVRLWQRFRLAVIPYSKIESDVGMPHNMVNSILYDVTRWDNKYMKYKFWGSSIFLVLHKTN